MHNWKKLVLLEWPARKATVIVVGVAVAVKSSAPMVSLVLFEHGGSFACAGAADPRVASSSSAGAAHPPDARTRPERRDRKRVEEAAPAGRRRRGVGLRDERSRRASSARPMASAARQECGACRGEPPGVRTRLGPFESRAASGHAEASSDTGCGPETPVRRRHSFQADPEFVNSHLPSSGAPHNRRLALFSTMLSEFRSLFSINYVYLNLDFIIFPFIARPVYPPPPSWPPVPEARRRSVCRSGRRGVLYRGVQARPQWPGLASSDRPVRTGRRAGH